MADTVTNELMYQVLKPIQGRLDHVDHSLRDVQNMQIMVREDIHRLAGGQLRLERMNAETQVRLDRIDKRLSLVDA